MEGNIDMEIVKNRILEGVHKIKKIDKVEIGFYSAYLRDMLL